MACLTRSTALSAALLFAAPAADADVLVELFTSQGCSSCPPADEMFERLVEENADVVALAFHVHYWDYLGWRDTFAAPAFTARQAAYRDAWDQRIVYTPQMIVQGRFAVDATSPAAIAKAIDKAPSWDAIRIERRNGAFAARLLPDGPTRPCTIWVARFVKRTTVDIARGENSGRSIDYVNTVTSLEKMGVWDGREPLELMLPQPSPEEGIAVWLQDGHGGPVMAVARTP